MAQFHWHFCSDLEVLICPLHQQEERQPYKIA